MIKKLLTTGLLLGTLVSSAQENMVTGTGKISGSLADAVKSNNAANKTAVVAIQDTLGYFINKTLHKYANNFFTVKLPHTGTVQVNTEFGASFLNPNNEAVTVSGAVVLAARMASSPTQSLPLTVTLYSANPAGLPTASVATASCVITGTGGVYSSFAMFSTPQVMNGAYCIMYKHNQVNAQDTLNVFLTPAFTATSNAVPANQKYGESLGFFRNNGNLFSMTNYYNPGQGTDLEPVVIPFVAFSYSADATVTAPNSTATPGAYCANLPISFTNTSSQLSQNRQYNFNAFVAHWGPQTSTITGLPTGDPVNNWSFAGPPTPTAAYTTTNVSHTYGTTGNASANLIVKYQKGSGSKVKSQDVKSWTLQIANCGIVGIDENNFSNTNLNVYPNPLTNGKLNIAGLEGSNTITVYNLMGQLVATQSTEAETASVDLMNQPAGTYVVKVTDSSNRSKLVKVINQ